jgi:Kinesin-associated protein (KAP)
MVAAGAIDLLTPLLSSANSDLINAVVRLLLNLSFDSSVRARMVKAGMLPRLVALLPDPGTPSLRIVLKCFRVFAFVQGNRPEYSYFLIL